ncbi:MULTISPECIES: Crp/Fnr family transcriptional regulator [unclassified Roseovarius]|jgi:CRP/FNR family cyclic AMP-dependent transcriptional regulator|uniref:Crp/Fnr family transcriptional regulator n=1 Tax=unclassified Roseovarius TaxID=2614913 RepID=UPI000068675A|nr:MULTISPECIES: Crp/Fnr family transcriptional regulator [unclassified Roseovarius]EAQ23497.1 putative Crp/Fnr-family transcriptional regulator [Roseovarius sp. 217]KJS42684.1 MAG: Crp/Fnr family transcriptional regulator [Roseovarius sp. BRH_c41]
MISKAEQRQATEGLVGLLERHGRAVEFKRGQMIYTTGADDTSMMLITKGRVEISRSSLEGRRSILTHLGPGDMLGELAALDGGPRSADAVAATGVRGRVLARPQVLQLLQDHPDAAIDVIGMLCRRLRETSGMYTAHMLADGQARLARLLLHLSEKWGEVLPGGKLRLAERFSQSDLGDLVGLSRESVNRQIREWEQVGLIERQGQGIVLCDPAALAQAAETAE